MKNILVIGSSNTDMVVKTAHLPKAGETIIGSAFMMNPGGKGANQAVAAARAGANVVFIAKTGDDLFGANAIHGFKKEGIDVSHIKKDAVHPSGVALITVDENGENNIVVAPGANNQLHETDIPLNVIEAADIILMQLEIPLTTVITAATIAKELQKKCIINPAPAATLPDDLLNNLFLIAPNETETFYLTNVEIKDNVSVKNAANILLNKGVQNAIITLGEKGIYYSNGIKDFFVASPKVKAVDTTAAGDVFNGVLAAALANDMDWETACTLACKAASISVTRMGAQASAPYAHEL